MTSTQIAELCSFYDNILYEKFSVKAKSLTEEQGKLLGSDIKDIEIIAHIRWMCQRVEFFLENGDMDRVNRWLGFIQGVLFSEGICTIADMRDQNRGGVC